MDTSEERELSAARSASVGGEGESQPQARGEDIPSVQDLLARDLARLVDLVPAETRHHLKRAGTEASLALFHLWRSIESEVRGPQKPKVRKRIDVE
jgi:hypothetical protein